MTYACFGRPCDSCLFDTCPKSNINKAREYMSECCKKREGADGWCTCGTCPFSLTNNKYSIPCGHLTDNQIINIYILNKEEESMTKKEEIQNEIEKTQKQLAALQEKLKEAENEVPEKLDISNGDRYDYVYSDGSISWTNYARTSLADINRVRNHRAFLSEEYAREFAEKTQFVADMLHFKWLYDKDYKPDLNDGFKCKYCIYYNSDTKQFESGFNTGYSHTESVYFSTNELARRCAEWLNKKYGYTKE